MLVGTFKIPAAFTCCRLTFLIALLLFLTCKVKDEESKSVDETGDRDGACFVLTDVTVAAGLGDFKYYNGAVGSMWFPEQMGPGCAFLDYNNDDWPDILLIGGGSFPGYEKEFASGLYLYENLGNSKFRLVNEESGLAGVAAYGLGLGVADFDNDGDQDFYLTTLRRNMFFRNDNGAFTEIGEDAGVADQEVWSSSANFFDADKDGWLDLYVANYADWSPETDVFCGLADNTKVYCPPGQYTGIPGRFYHNNRNGTFTDQTAASGFFESSPGKSLGTVEFDYNRDGWPDLVVANDGEGDLLYESNRDGTFTEKGMSSGMAYSEHGEARAGMGIDVGVLDDSRHESIVIGHFEKEMIGVFQYMGDGMFVSRSAISRIGRSSLSSLTFGINLFDIDLDGDLDVFAANGHVYILRLDPKSGVTYRQQSQLFLNRGDGVFDEFTPSPGDASLRKMVARGSAYGDFDRDGDLDMLIAENGEKYGPVRLWRNDLQDGRFLRVRLKGTKSNRDGIGAQIEAVAGGRHMYRRIRSVSSYLSQSEKVATFGLGRMAQVDTLKVEWPSGIVQQFVIVAANQEVLITEDEPELKEISRTDKIANRAEL